MQIFNNKINKMKQQSKVQNRQQNNIQQANNQGNNTLHIGIKSSRLSCNTYSTKVVSYSQHSHLVINHGQELSIYNSKLNQIINKTHHHHSSPYINATFSNKWKCIFLIDQSQKITVYTYANPHPNATTNNNSSFSDQLVLLASQLDIKSIRHCIDFIFMDEYNAFVVLDANCLKIVFVDVNTNHLRSLFSNAFRFKIQQNAVKVLSNCYFLQFANKIYRFGQYFVLANAQDVKIIWHSIDRNFKDKQSQSEQQVSQIAEQILILATGRSHITSNIPNKSIILLQKICQSPEQITQVFYNPQLHTLACGSNQGQLKVYKVNIRNIIATNSTSSLNSSSVNLNSNKKKLKSIKIDSKSQLAFKLVLHNNKPIKSIQMYSPNILLTIGLDQYLEVISFDQMASIQKFKCDNNLANMVFVSNNLFLAVKTIEFDQYLYGYQVALNCQLIMHHNSQILYSMFCKGMCVIVLTDNSLNVLQLGRKQKKGKTKERKNTLLSINQKQKKVHEKNKIISQTHKGNKQKQQNMAKLQQNYSQNQSMIPKQSFIPPRCKSILAVQNYPYRANTEKQKQKQSNKLKQEYFWILTDQSQIYSYVYTYQATTQSQAIPIANNINSKDLQARKPEKQEPSQAQFHISQIVELKSFIDKYKHATKQKVITMKFVNIVPVQYDSDVKQKNYYPNYSHVNDVKPIAFGCQTGELLICSSLQPDKVITRVRYLGQPVRSICQCSFTDNKKFEQVRSDKFEAQISRRKKSIFSIDQQIQLNGEDQHKNKTHVKKLFILGGYRQVLVIILSNWHIPVIVYKLLMPQTNFILKNINKYMATIITDNTPKIFLPINYRTQIQQNLAARNIQSPSKVSQSSTLKSHRLKLWVPSTNIHQSTITCIEYCSQLKILSGDQMGNIIMWTLNNQEILIAIKISQSVRIQLCYWENNTIIFGHHGKIFQMDKNQIKLKSSPSHTNSYQIQNKASQKGNISKIKLRRQSSILSTQHQMQQQQTFIVQQFLNNTKWIDQNCYELSLQTHTSSPTRKEKTNKQIIKQFFKFVKPASQYEPTQLQVQTIVNSGQRSGQSGVNKGTSKQLSKSKQKQRQKIKKSQFELQLQKELKLRGEEQIDNYVQDAKKQLIKLTKQTHSYNPDKSASPFHEQDSQTKFQFKMASINKLKLKNKNKSKSHLKHQLSSNSTKHHGNLSARIKIQSDNLYTEQKVSQFVLHNDNTNLGNKNRNKLVRAKSILNRFKQAQEKQYSFNSKNNELSKQLTLPQIKNISKILIPNQTMVKIEQNLKSQEYVNQNQGTISARRNKNRNKKYQYLFHFPNVGLYSQLISKNMLE